MGTGTGQPDKEKEADESRERESWGIDAQAWDAAFSWADEPAPALAAVPLAANGAFAVWRCNWATVGCFLACRTQWRTSPMGRVQGLDYAAVELVMRLRNVEDKAAMFAKLQSMEMEALEVFNV